MKAKQLKQIVEHTSEYWPTLDEAAYWFRFFNKEIFDNVLIFHHQTIQIKKISDAWGYVDITDDDSTDWWMVLNESFKDKRKFLEILAHEMIHGWQFQELGKKYAGHGKNFFKFKPKFTKLGIELHRKY